MLKWRGIIQDYPQEFHGKSLEDSYIRACPFTYITKERNGDRYLQPEYNEWCAAYVNYLNGFLPEAGGLNDQPAALTDIISVAGAAYHHVTELESKKR